MTLTEVVVVMVAAAVLAVLTFPAVRIFLRSFESQGSARTLINSSLAAARAIAAREQSYAGVRFQASGDPNNVLNAGQYMVFIIHDPQLLAHGFRAVEGMKPVRLPDTVGVTDLRYRTDAADPNNSGSDQVDSDADITDTYRLYDTMAFSVVFSPSGKLVMHEVRTRNRDGVYRPGITESRDDVFNSLENIRSADGAGTFVQDDYADMGLGAELSRNSFVIYERSRLRDAFGRGRAWSNYLAELKPKMIHINPYTGSMIAR
jgi:hypothetical protein